MTEDALTSVKDLGLPVGPPLRLEEPGRCLEVLGPFLQAERIERLREVLARRTRHVTVLAERLHDEHNIAACVRSCEAFGIQDLHLVPQEDLRKKRKMSIMVSTGSHKWLSMRRHATSTEAVEHLRAQGYRIVVADPPGDHPSTSVDALCLDRPLALVIGNEREGVSPQVRALADERVHAPMAGFVESLNVSVACAVLLCQVRARLDRDLGSAALMSAADQTRLLDLWVARDVPRVGEVVTELIRRAP